MRRITSSVLFTLVVIWVLAIVPQSPILGPFLLLSEAVRSFPLVLLGSWIAVVAIAILTWRTDHARVALALGVLGICSAVYTARVWSFLPLFARTPSEIGATDTLIDIAVVNVEFGRARPQQLREKLPKKLPDLLVVSEVTAKWLAEAAFTSEYQFSVTAPGTSAEGIAVFSRYPFEGSTDISPGFFKTLSLSMRLAEDRPLRLIALHAPPPHADLSFEFRHAYFTLLDTHILSLPASEPLLLAGDFNTTPASDSYRTFVSQHKLRNSAEGRGFPNTWPVKFFPWVGAYIDQVVYRGTIDVVDLRALESFGSDHRPLFATFRISSR